MEANEIWSWWRRDLWWAFGLVAVVSVSVVASWIVMIRARRRSRNQSEEFRHTWPRLLLAVSITLFWLGLIFLVPQLAFPSVPGSPVPQVWQTLSALGVGLIGAAVVGGFIGTVQQVVDEKSSIAAERRDLRNMLRNGTDFRGIDLGSRSADDRQRKDLSGLYLRGRNFSDADMRRVIISDSDLLDADFTKAWLDGADFSEADMRGAKLSQARMPGAVLHRAWLMGADLTGCDLARADLTEAVLVGADLTGTNLEHADLSSVRWNSRELDADFTVDGNGYSGPPTKWPAGFRPPQDSHDLAAEDRRRT